MNRNGKYSVTTVKYTENGLTHKQAMNLGQHIRNKNEAVAVHIGDKTLWSYLPPTPFENL